MTRRTGSHRDARDKPEALKVARLKHRHEYLAVAAARRKWVAPGVVLQARRRDAEPGTVDAAAIRYGITASRKVGNAVARNRAKRRLRAAANEVLPVSGRPGYDIVLIARTATLDRPFADLKTDLATGIAKLTAKRRPAKPTDLER